MNRFYCCLKGESSTPAVPESSSESEDELPEPTEPAVSESSEESVEMVLYPIENNEYTDDPHHPIFDFPFPEPRFRPLPPPPPISRLGVRIRWSTIIEGTEDLRDINFLGEGYFGLVYRCNLPRFHQVGAVKIQRIIGLHDDPEYVRELTVLHKANHPNVIRLLGKCHEVHHCAIVYEFMPRGSLDHHVYTDTWIGLGLGLGLLRERPVLSWYRRIRIAVAVAEALVYLHSELKVIHRDIQLKNVLLDEFYVPKLSGFGSAIKIVVRDGREQPFRIFPIKGCPGYIAPETENEGLVSTMSDVYSYGVFLLTLFTGMKVYDLQRHGIWKICDAFNSVRYARLATDLRLGNRYSRDGLEAIFQITRACTDPYAGFRPSMGNVEARVRSVFNYEIPDWTRHTRWSD